MGFDRSSINLTHGKCVGETNGMQTLDIMSVWSKMLVAGAVWAEAYPSPACLRNTGLYLAQARHEP